MNGGAPVNDVYYLGHGWWFPIAQLWSGILAWVAPVFGAIFALHLLHDGPLPARRRRLGYAIYAVMLGAVACGVAESLLFCFFGIDWGEGAFIATALTSLAYVSIPAILLATYAESDVATRERLRWVIWAFSIGALAAVADLLGTQGNLGLYSTTYLEHSLLLLAYTLLPAVVVLYTILKHRIIDVNVAISRAVVYGVISTLVVGLFALVDLFFSRALSSVRIGLIADMGLALVLGFSFNAFHARVDRLMDWLFFRARHRAEEHIAAVASAIPYARTEEHVNRLLINEPVRAFGLVDGMLWRGGDAPTDDVESLVAILRAAQGVAAERTAYGARVPIFSDAELEAIAFYAPHSNGTDIDSDGLSLIERAANAAGGAYARFKALALRKRVAELEAELQAVRV